MVNGPGDRCLGITAEHGLSLDTIRDRALAMAALEGNDLLPMLPLALKRCEKTAVRTDLPVLPD